MKNYIKMSFSSQYNSMYYGQLLTDHYYGQWNQQNQQNALTNQQLNNLPTSQQQQGVTQQQQGVTQQQQGVTQQQQGVTQQQAYSQFKPPLSYDQGTFPPQQQQGAKSMQGSIALPNDFPEETPPNSCAVIKFQDTSVQDVEASVLSKQVLREPKKSNLKAYSFQIGNDASKLPESEGSVSAVVNMGWCGADSTTGEWIRKGDYLTDTNFSIEKMALLGKSDVIKGPDIGLVKY